MDKNTTRAGAKKTTRQAKPFREAMSLESIEMGIRGFAGVGTVCREDGENFIVVGRDEIALLKFWGRWSPDYVPDPTKYKNAVVINSRYLGLSRCKSKTNALRKKKKTSVTNARKRK